MTVRYSSDDDTLFADEISNVEGENRTVDSSIAAFTFALEQRVCEDARTDPKHLISKPDAEPRFSTLVIGCSL